MAFPYSSYTELICPFHTFPVSPVRDGEALSPPHTWAPRPPLPTMWWTLPPPPLPSAYCILTPPPMPPPPRTFYDDPVFLTAASPNHAPYHVPYLLEGVSSFVSFVQGTLSPSDRGPFLNIPQPDSDPGMEATLSVKEETPSPMEGSSQGMEGTSPGMVATSPN